jgi:hypothetical protein
MDENDGIVEAAHLKVQDLENADEKVDRIDSNVESEEKPKDTKMEHATAPGSV